MECHVPTNFVECHIFLVILESSVRAYLQQLQYKTMPGKMLLFSMNVTRCRVLGGFGRLFVEYYPDERKVNDYHFTSGATFRSATFAAGCAKKFVGHHTLTQK
uniref:Uncharacterized protein n=1 Tax=Romanomermis culicivorax TaxID=13658 RepID=A0A915K2V8_ROMCU